MKISAKASVIGPAAILGSNLSACKSDGMLKPKKQAQNCASAMLALIAIAENPPCFDFRHRRGLDQALLMQLARCAWIKEHQNVIIFGPTGVGKTYLACALAHEACREGYSAIYSRLPTLLQEFSLSRDDDRYTRLLRSIARADLIVLDGWGFKSFSVDQQYDLLEVLEDCHGLRSTLVISQLATDHWYELITNSIGANAILRSAGPQRPPHHAERRIYAQTQKPID